MPISASPNEISATPISSIVLTHGTRIHNGSAVFVHLGRKDIPEDDLRISRWRRLEGTVLVLDPQSGHHLTTAYRNRQNGMKDIKRKRKYRISSRFEC